MKLKKYIALLSSSLLLLSACEKIEKGFLSDAPRYVNGTIVVPRGGIYIASEKINADGSTQPYTFKLLNLRDKDTGQPAPEEFFTNYDVLMFKAGQVFDATKDTTVELLNAKRETISTAPFVFNEASGQLVFNRASANLPLGNFVFDVEMSNPKGTKLFQDFGQVNIVDPTLDDFFQVTYQAATGSDAQETFFTTSAPQVTCERISAEGARVILKIVDKNGNPFDPSAGEVIRRGDRPTFESHVKFNPIVSTDTAMICDFEVSPFPLTNYFDGTTDWSYLIYYRIPSRFASIDNYGPGLNVNPVFGFRVLMEGTYIVTVRLPTVTRRTP